MQVLFEAEKGVAMGDKAMDRFSGRQPSPRLEELEERQQAVEEVGEAKSRMQALTQPRAASCSYRRWGSLRHFQLLPRVESLVCDATRRLALILPRMSDGGERATAIRNRTRDVETRFRDLVRAAREARVRLDARAVDQAQLKQDLENLQFWLVHCCRPRCC